VLGSVLNMAKASGAHGYYGYGYAGEYATRTDRPKLTSIDAPAAVPTENGHRRTSSRAG
jgi:hypothetical protein